MKKTTAIIVDDEIGALKGLQQKIASLFPKIQITATFQSPEEAIKFIKKQPPDLLFLDIEMPRLTGFELLSELELVDFQVIFVTAYSEYAIQAFKESAIGYIVKPIDNEELVKVVNNALRIIELNHQNENNLKLVEILTETLGNTDKIVIPSAKGLSFIPQEQLVHLQGFEGYTYIFLEDGTKYTSSYNIGRFEKKLNKIFFKCHKSHIVNLSKVRHLENEGYLVLENGVRLPISKANKKVFLKMFG